MPRDLPKTVSESQEGRAETIGSVRPMTASSLPTYDTNRKRASASLSVIVPAYNEQYLVETSLERLKILRDSSLLHLVKVIVVDDGSTDETADAIARFRTSLEQDVRDDKLQWQGCGHPHGSFRGHDRARRHS